MKPANMRRRRASQRKSAPSVICLPPPKPPIATPAARPSSSAENRAALPLPRIKELHVEQPASLARPANRQQRRQQERMAARQAEIGPQSETIAPLPRNRSLALVSNRWVAKVTGWLREIVAARLPVAAWLPTVTPQRRVAHPAAQELRALRRDVARLQASLDAMMKRAAS